MLMYIASLIVSVLRSKYWGAMLFWPHVNEGRVMPRPSPSGTVPRKSLSRWNRKVFTLLFANTQLCSPTRLCACTLSSVELVVSLRPSS